jgi:AcrR family transcriptional regulator
MTARKPPRRTRERILAASLQLFNRDGEPHVTTAHVADELGISPGNLYYHFRSKDEILLELYDAFDRDVRTLFSAAAPEAVDVEDLWLLLHLLFERMEAYRFLFRDLADLATRHPRLGARLARLLRLVESTLLAVCRGMIAGGAMRASEHEIAALARNALLVATFWMAFAQVIAPAARPEATERDLGRAAYQVLVLMAPYLTGDSRALLTRLAQDYVQGEG